MRCFCLAALVVLNVLSCADAQEKSSQWHGFERVDFSLEDRACILVYPKTPAEGRPWVWRARFFGHEPQADVELLNLGFHVAYCDVAGLYGSSRAVEAWDAFYAHMIGTHDLARKVALEGMSRGGMIIYNWAAQNPEKVACLYGDAPVCDLRSWPGGKGEGKGSEPSWREALKVYDLTEEKASAFKGNPIDNLEPLVRAKVPILHVIGDADKVVPPSENSAVVEKRYRELGGDIKVISKPGVGHHPHALKNPKPIVDFITKNTTAALSRPMKSTNVKVRRGLPNARAVFETGEKGHVAFIGGSITEMNGYRPMVCENLRRRFPATEFRFTNAGISSTCSTTGAFRLESDVLSRGPVDLLFVEFAVNDDQDAAHARRECIRGLEGIIRHVHRHNPKADVVVTYFVNPTMLKVLRENKTPLAIEAHDSVTSHYNIPTVHLAKEIALRINDRRLTWKQFGGTHPAPYGNRICADLIDQLLTETWATREKGNVGPHALPEPLDTSCYEKGRFLETGSVDFKKEDWMLGVPDWKNIDGNCRPRFHDVEMLSTNKVGSELRLEFVGSAVGAYLLAGPDAGSVEYSIDGGDFVTMDLYHRHSKGLHYPRTVMFGAGLEPRKHTLRLRVASDPSGKRSAVRILRFVAN